MRSAWGLWAVSLIFCVPAAAGSALYPEASAWGALQEGGALADRKAEADYMAIIAAAVPEAFGPQLRLRLIIDQDGRGPKIVGLKKTDSGYRIVAGEPDAWLKLTPKAPVSRCAIAVEPKLGDALTAAWKSVLLSTSYAEKPAFGAKGEIDHFVMSLDGRWLAGWAYSPESDTPPGRLQNVAMAMIAICMHDDAQEQQRLQTALSEFSKP